MDAITKLPKKHTYIILLTLGLIIFSMSMETMMRVKDLSLYDTWYQEMVTKDLNISYEEAFNVYVTGSLSIYFFNVLVPMALGIHTYFAYTKIRINKLFVFIWVVLLVGATAYIVVSRVFDSVFYYINIGGYIVLIVTILSLLDVINETMKR